MKFISLRVITANRGDLFSRWGLLQALQAYTSTPITVACLSDAHLPPGAFEAVPYGALHNAVLPGQALAAARAADTMVWTGGLDLQDDSSLIKLIHTLLVFISYRLLGLRIILLMQGAGPLTTRIGRWLTRRILNRVDIALIRDRGSFRLLTDIGSRAHLKLCHDGIFLPGFPGATASAADLSEIDRLTARSAGVPLIALNVRLWFHLSSSWIPYQFAQARYQDRSKAKMDRLVAVLADEVQRLRDRYRARIVLVSMYEPGAEPWEDDLGFLQQLKQARFNVDEDVRVLEAPIGIPAFFELLGRCDLVIGMRLHSTLIALRAGVPAIHLAYTLKGFDIYADLGLSDLVLPVEKAMDDPKSLADMIDIALGDASMRSRVAASAAMAGAINALLLDDTFAPPQKAQV